MNTSFGPGVHTLHPYEHLIERMTGKTRALLPARSARMPGIRLTFFVGSRLLAGRELDLFYTVGILDERAASSATPFSLMFSCSSARSTAGLST